MYTYKADGELSSLVGLVCLVAKHGQACAFEAYMFIIHRQTQARMVNAEWYDTTSLYFSVFLCINGDEEKKNKKMYLA